MSTLTDRIALILQTEAASDALAGLIDDARQELAAVNEACVDAKARVLDPFSTSAVVARARKELDEFSLTASRLEAAIDRLAGQLETARAREAEAARSKLYEDAKADRDVLVEDIRKIYPEAAARIAALLPRIDAADAKITAANADLPEGASWLEPVEHIARGRPSHEGSPLSRSVKLPALLQSDYYSNPFWPVGRQ
jgi:hypothetical protein